MTPEELEPHIIYEMNHYDGPISGLARIDGQLFYFDAVEYGEDGYPDKYKMTLLTRWAKCKALCSKYWFEFCIGTYWSRDRKKQHYYPGRPLWLRRILWSAFYGNWPSDG